MIEAKANYMAMVILALVAIIIAIYSLITHSKKLSVWLEKRQKRRHTLDLLIDNADNIQCTSVLKNQIEELSKSVEELKSITAENIEHNKRQDKEIERSLRQRQVQDMALFALLDVQRQEGRNGPITKAYEAMHDYMLSESSKSYAEILKKKED